ncbi:MAG: T9SS type A sorting domain-containing protein [Bacteroidales bacterium]|nr:T9SS type A sorting domain-containing protein [Bacteroidales bacterium]
MLKNLLSIGMVLLLASGLCAQEQGNNALHKNAGKSGAKTITFPASDIQFWTGQGSNQAVVILAWDDNTNGSNIALAWGVRWNGNAMATSLLDSIAAYDSRFSYTLSGSLMTNMSYNDGTVNPQSSTNGWCYYLNGNWAPNAWPNQPVNNNDVIEMSSSCMWSMTTATAATDPNPSAPEDASIDASNIVYWVGEGNNQVVLAVNWADTALAWGYRFSGESTSVSTMMSDIAAADPRFSYVTGSWGIDDINFTAGSTTLGVTPGNYWWSLLNHVGGMGMGDMLHDGDFYKWGDLAVAVITDSTWVDYGGGYAYWDYTYIWPYDITPVSVPEITDAEIAADNILYWVGEGNNQVVLAVNWADTALAWGYRFSGENTSVSTMMADIANADPRFSYVTGSWGIDDINYNVDNLSLGVTPGNYWWSLLNHIGGMGMGDILHDGDFYKWGDLAVAVITDSTWVDYGGGYAYWDYTYVWPYAITPVSNPNNDPEVGPFCGAVGSEGCTAIAYNDSRIKAWATGCTIVRGSQNLSDPDAPLVTFGSESDAVGPATTSTTDVVSLGDGGSATLTFAKPIKNGDGFDFAVYENSFNDSFLELAFVEVSSDGINFVRFPATSLTQTNAQIGGNGSVDPTFINNLAGKYRVGYGTPFDLAELADSTGIDINNITHVRIVDVVGSIDPQYGTYDAFGHIINDPFPNNSYSAGFDLDGVAVLNQAGEGFDAIEESVVKIYPNPANEYAIVNCDDHASVVSVEMFDMTGRLVYSRTLEPGTNQFQIGTSRIANGIYMLRIGDNTQKLVVRH